MKHYAIIICPCGNQFEYEDPNIEEGEILPSCSECGNQLEVESSVFNLPDEEGNESGTVHARLRSDQ